MPSPGSKMLRGHSGGSSGRIPNSNVQVGLVTAASWSQHSGTWIVARAAYPGTQLPEGRKGNGSLGVSWESFVKASLEPTPPALPGVRSSLNLCVEFILFLNTGSDFVLSPDS